MCDNSFAIKSLITQSKKLQNDYKLNFLTNKSENLQTNVNEPENKWNLIIPPFWNNCELNNYVTEIVDDFFNQPIKKVNVPCKNNRKPENLRPLPTTKSLPVTARLTTKIQPKRKINLSETVPNLNSKKIDFVERNKIITRKIEKLRPSTIPEPLPVANKTLNKRKINLADENLNLNSSSKAIFPCRVLTTDDETIKSKEQKNIKNVKKESTWHEVFHNRHKVRTKDQALKNCEIINTEFKGNEACNTQKNVIIRGEKEDKAGETETICEFIDQKNLNIKKNCNIQMLPVMSIRGVILNSVQKLHKISLTPAVTKKPNAISYDEPKNIKYCQFIYNENKMRDETINDGIDNRIQLDDTEIEEQKNLWNGKSNKNSNCQTETNPEDFLFENKNINSIRDNTDETIENSKSYLCDLKDSNTDKIAPFSITLKENQNQIENTDVSYNSSFEKTITSSSDISMTLTVDEKIGKRKRKSKAERDLRQKNQVNVLSDGSCQQKDTNKLEKRDFMKQQVSC